MTKTEIRPFTLHSRTPAMNTAHVISLMLSTRRIVGKRVSSQTVRNALAVNPNITAEGIALSLLGR